MSPRQETLKLLLANGYEEKRQGKKHTIFYSPVTKKTIPVKRHDFDEEDMRYILKEAGIKP